MTDPMTEKATPHTPEALATARRISAEVRLAGGPPELALQNRCWWDAVPRVDVIIKYGDPRKWDGSGNAGVGYGGGPS